MNYPVLSHGSFTSPHLIDRWDCITINQRSVSFKLFDHVERRVLKRNDEEDIGASEFELLTATAFEIFTHEHLDLAVVEVGMGGRLDATNILGHPSGGAKVFHAAPLVTAITKIGLDHQAFLGNTLTEIAREKAGIVKPGVPVVLDMSNDVEVKAAVEEVAKDNRMIQPHHLKLATRALTENGHPAQAYSNTQAVSHVLINREIALRSTLTALEELGLHLFDPSLTNHEHSSEYTSDCHASATTLVEDMFKASARSNVPGRQSYIDLTPLGIPRSDVMLDGGHNEQAATALMDTLTEQPKPNSSGNERDSIGRTWIIALTSTKDVEQMLRVLLRPGDKLFAVEFGPVAGMPWVQPTKAQDIIDAATGTVTSPGLAEAHACGMEVLRALRLAHDATPAAADHPGEMVIAGSLYLVGDVMRLLRDAAVGQGGTG
ncbi:hypothetical protein LTR62_005597 [Meristemomyces frigidus]|uniref:Folylpolyglutamate synthase n=1 Tax=Meristemomyces frigidus TaxID=1508187 RepID=A0AAN7TEB1_9PEZI|nr:hypothetical protein LTR62_005597 [Meristemomyces frigidus]